MQARTLENQGERNRVVWENQRSRDDGVEFKRPVTMQEGWKTRRTDRGLPEVLELENPGETSERNLEETDLDGSL